MTINVLGNGISARNRDSDIPLLEPCDQRNCRRDTTLVSKSENLGCEKEEEDTYSLRHRKCGVRGFQELFVSTKKKPERARYDRVRAFDTDNELIQPRTKHFLKMTESNFAIFKHLIWLEIYQ